MKRLLKVLLLALLSLSLAACSKTTQGKEESGTQKETSEMVSVKSITAVNCLAQSAIVNGVKQKHKTVNPVIKDEGIEEVTSDYILIYQDEKDIQLTVTLDNPKKTSIDALEISCDDPDATIYVNDGYGNSSYKKLTDATIANVINWTSSSAVTMTFYMQVASSAKLTTVKITDIKTNDGWQAKELTNNELDVYKVTESDIKYEFVANTKEYYEFKLITGETVSNLVVSGATLGENGNYKVTENGEISWSYDYIYNDKTLHSVNEKDIELLTIATIAEQFPTNCFSDDSKIWLSNVNFSGTDVYDNLYIIYNDNHYELNYNDSYASSKFFTNEIPTLSDTIRTNENVEVYCGNVCIITLHGDSEYEITE